MGRRGYFFIRLVFFLSIGSSTVVSCQTSEEIMSASMRLSDILVSESQWLNHLQFDIEPGVSVKSVNIETSEDKSWIVRKGESRIGNCIVERYPLVDVDGKHFLKLSEFAERCTGIGCSECSFGEEQGSCICNNLAPWRRCKHSMIKISDVIRLKSSH